MLYFPITCRGCSCTWCSALCGNSQAIVPWREGTVRGGRATMSQPHPASLLLLWQVCALPSEILGLLSDALWLVRTQGRSVPPSAGVCSCAEPCVLTPVLGGGWPDCLGTGLFWREEWGVRSSLVVLRCLGWASWLDCSALGVMDMLPLEARWVPGCCPVPSQPHINFLLFSFGGRYVVKGAYLICHHAAFQAWGATKAS